MSAPAAPGPRPSHGPQPAPGPQSQHPHRRVSPAQLAWLEAELTAWQRDGLIDSPTAARIRAGYQARRRFSLMALWITLGSCFLGAGLIWLVAANLDRFSPAGRLALVAAIWIGLTVGVEWFAARRHPAGSAWWVASEALRLLPVAGYGAVVFQAAQSLQVPAFAPVLVLVWALGTLTYAYLVKGTTPLFLGVVLLAVWAVWFPLSNVEGDGMHLVLAGAGTAFVALGAVQRRLGWAEATVPWREIGLLGVLVGMFFAFIPTGMPTTWTVPTIAWLVAALVLAAAGVVAGTREDRWSLLLVVAATGCCVLFTFWPVPSGMNPQDAPAWVYLRAALAVLLYLVTATAAAVLGALVDSQRITVLAGIMLTLFTTLQAFAVFAPILSGAVLFLTLGVILIAIGWAADRGRRRLFPRTRLHTLRNR